MSSFLRDANVDTDRLWDLLGSSLDALLIARVSDHRLIACSAPLLELAGITRKKLVSMTLEELGTWEGEKVSGEFWSSLVSCPLVLGHRFVLKSQSAPEIGGELSAALLTFSGQSLAICTFRPHAVPDPTLESMDRQVRFEQLITNLSSRFISLPADQVDHQIESGLGEVRDFLNVDRAGLMKVSEDQLRIILTHASLGDKVPLPFPIGTDVAPFFPWLADLTAVKGQTFRAESLDEFPEHGLVDRESHRSVLVEAMIIVPIFVGGVVSHLITANSQTARKWPAEFAPRLGVLGEIFVNALHRKSEDEERRKAFREICELRDRLQAEAETLRSEIQLSHRHGEILGQSPAIQSLLEKVEQVAPTDSHVLITGETGTGKELVARAIHAQSARSDRIMVVVNCAALPPSLIESELFGREKGAYTGALTRQVGRFEVADKGTIFLDEVGELPLELQSKLLRVLQNGEVDRLGSSKTLKVDVRVIAATNRDLVEAVRRGTFRRDLYYRLNVYPITVPPLRERPDDIPLLVWAFIEELGKKMGKNIESISNKSMEQLVRYSWPGNVRELRNTIERAMIQTRGTSLRVDVPMDTFGGSDAFPTLEQMEIRYIRQVLESTDGQIKGPDGAASRLGVPPSTLYSRMEKLGIVRP